MTIFPRKLQKMTLKGQQAKITKVLYYQDFFLKNTVSRETMKD